MTNKNRQSESKEEGANYFKANQATKHMNKLIAATVAVFLIAACGRPINFTMNPDDHTTTSGTLGSAKMTNELPKKSDNMKIPDTIRRTTDSIPRY